MLLGVSHHSCVHYGAEESQERKVKKGVSPTKTETRAVGDKNWGGVTFKTFMLLSVFTTHPFMQIR